jgi:hypothetical protein
VVGSEPADVNAKRVAAGHLPPPADHTFSHHDAAIGVRAQNRQWRLDEMHFISPLCHFRGFQLILLHPFGD